MDNPDFESIVQVHQGMLYSIAHRFFHNTDLAEEIAQDVFWELYGRLKDIESPDHLVAWLRRTAINRCIDVTRSRSWRNEVQLKDDSPAATVESAEPDPFLKEKLQRLVASLPEKQWAVVILRYTE